MFEKVKIAQDKHGWIDKKFKEVCLMNLYSTCFSGIAQVGLTIFFKVDSCDCLYLISTAINLISFFIYFLFDKDNVYPDECVNIFCYVYRP